MEAVELKKILEAYDRKLDKTLRLNKLSMKNIQLEKSQNSTKKILISRVFEVAAFSFLTIFLSRYIANNWDHTHLLISGVIVNIFSLLALVGSIGQLVLLQQIDYSKPIVEIRKKIELINAHGLLFVKIIFLSAPFWWSYAIVAIDLFLGVDLYVHLDSDFVLRYLVFNFLLIIPLIWFLNKLSYKNLHINWIRKTIGFLIGRKTNKALIFLNEIEKFEN